MKRFNGKTFLAIFGMSAIFSIFSCNFELPEKISVKTSGTKYSFPLGSGSFLLREKISASELRKTFNENLDDDAPEIKVYDYNPTQSDSDVIRYLIKYPIKEISLGLSADGSNEIDFNTSISISNLNETISNAVTIENLTYPIVVPGMKVNIPETTGIPFEFSKPEFSTIEVSSGKIKVEVTAPSNVSSDFVLSAKLVLCDTNNEEVAASDTIDIANGTGSTPFYLDLSGKTISKKMKLKLSGSMSGGNPLEGTKEYSLSMTAENFVVSKVTGLTMTAEDLGDIDDDSTTADGVVGFSQDFDFTGASDYLVSATIATGSINFYGKLPGGWSGINLTLNNVCVTQTGGLNLTQDNFTDVEDSDSTYLFYKEANLSGQTIVPTTDEEKITLTGEAGISFENATLVFDNSSSGTEIDVGGKCSIEKMGTLKVNISSLADNAETSGEIDTGLSFSTLLKDNLGDASNLVKNIQFSGIEGYVYAVQPGVDALDNVKFSNCTLEASYEVDGISETTSLIDGKSVDLVKTQLDLDSLADDDYMIISDVFGEVGSENYSVKTEENSICTLINKLPDNLKIKYDLSGLSLPKGNTLSLDSVALSKLQSLKAIQLYVLLDVPLNVTLNDTVDFPESSSTSDGKISILDVRELVRLINGDEEKENEDLLERDSSDDYEDYKKYLDMVESVTINYKANNTTTFAIDGYINDAATGISKTLTFTTTEATQDSTEEDSDDWQTFSLSQEEIKSIFNTYPFNPIIRLDIDADGNEKSIPRDAEFGIEGNVQITLSGQVELWSKNED